MLKAQEIYENVRLLKNKANLGSGNQPWFISIDWDDDLNTNLIDIVDKKGEKIFSINGTLEQASHICMMNNLQLGMLDHMMETMKYAR